MKHIALRPEVVRVMGREYVITWETPQNLAVMQAGLTNHLSLTITVVEGQHPVEEMDTLIHEIFHAVWFQMSIQEHAPEEEVIVRKMAGGFTQILIDNPHLLKYFTAIKNPLRKSK